MGDTLTTDERDELRILRRIVNALPATADDKPVCLHGNYYDREIETDADTGEEVRSGGWVGCGVFGIVQGEQGEYIVHLRDGEGREWESVAGELRAVLPEETDEDEHLRRTK